jgi:hypothetical protein
MGDAVFQRPLAELASNRFGRLSLAEERLAQGAAEGELADCTPLSGDDKNIRGDLLSWLCTNPQATAQLTYRGISIAGAEVIDEVNLAWAKISFPIRAFECVFRGVLLLDGGYMVFLNLEGSSLHHVSAPGAHFERSVLLRNGFIAQGGVNLTSAAIEGSLNCDGGHFAGNDKVLALNANVVHVNGFVLFRNSFIAKGGVDLRGAKIGEDLNCDGGQFIGNDKVLALNANSAQVKGHVLLRNGFRSEGGVSLVLAKIDGNLESDSAQFVGNETVTALDANSAKIEGNVFLHNDFIAKGGADFVGAKIGGNLVCNGGQFVGSGKVLALNVHGVQVKQDVLLRNGFIAKDGADFVGAKIEGNLECDGGQFIGKDKVLALNANDVQVKGSVFLRNGFRAEGGVDLGGAKIEGSVECAGGQFIGNDKVLALNANGVQVKGSVFLSNLFRGEGGVNLVAAKIDGNLDCSVGQFISKGDRPALTANSAKIDGNVFFSKFAAEGEVNFQAAYVARGFMWSNIESKDKAILDLRYFKVGLLRNSQDSWPGEGRLLLDGFVYDQIDEKASPNADVQLGWLHRQPQELFSFQPYEQLAAVLRQRGLLEDARKVMIEKNKDYAKRIHGRPAWLWYGLFGKLIGYGYRPWRAFGISLALIVIGCGLFNWGYTSKIVTPTEKEAYAVYVDKNGKDDHFDRYPVFNPFIYSAETFVPLLKLGISDHWMPNANRGDPVNLGIAVLPTGSLLRGYLWFHIIAGWVLTTLWVGGLTGLVKT